MSTLLTTFAIFLLLSGIFKGLRHWLYGGHIAIVASGVFCAHRYWLGEVDMFAAKLLLTIAVMHIPSINAVTYLAYYLDKGASKRDSWRIPERTLHHFALIGGSVAALIAQRRLRHKTQKQSFKVRFWLIIALQLATLIALIATLFFQNVA